MNKEQQQALETLKSLFKESKNRIDAVRQLLSDKGDDVIESLQQTVDELEDELEDVKKMKCDNRIYCGIGKIDFKTPSNLQLQLLMEAFESSINKQGSFFILQALQILSE
jgi:hypothetical protein